MERGKVLTVRNGSASKPCWRPHSVLPAGARFPSDGSISHSTWRWLHLGQMTMAVQLSPPSVSVCFLPPPTFFCSQSYQILLSSTHGPSFTESFDLKIFTLRYELLLWGHLGTPAFTRLQSLKLWLAIKHRCCSHAGVLQAPLNSHSLDSCLLFLHLELALFSILKSCVFHSRPSIVAA